VDGSECESVFVKVQVSVWGCEFITECRDKFKCLRVLL
jgi:hypothetical protein